MSSQPPSSLRKNRRCCHKSVVIGPSVCKLTKYELRVRGWPSARTRSARYSWFETSSVISPKSVVRGCRPCPYEKLPWTKKDSHLAPESRVAPTYLALKPMADRKPHFSPELPCWSVHDDMVRRRWLLRTRRLSSGLVQGKIDGGGPSNIRIASRSKLVDVLAAVERE